MSELVQTAVILPHFFSIPARRNNLRHSRLQRFPHCLIAVAAAICNQEISGNILDQSPQEQRTIRSGICCDKKSDRHTMHIHGKMYFAADPLLYAPYPDCLLPRRRRSGIPYTFIYLLSIIFRLVPTPYIIGNV